ncbi:hypothetical protein [Phenylobacterium sp.]|uniref:hypothetical protein n=1 Tax=Phenylobacterium sp. TaxID=1871053 RepID=UPI0025F9BFA8|nr:hypothetical protein [Phenylobacterium sp.]
MLEDRTIVELIYDPEARRTALAVCSPDGSVSIEAEVAVGSGEQLVPYDAANTLLANGCVLLPSAVGEAMSTGALLKKIQGFLHAYLDLPDTFAAIAAHYVLLTWVYDAFSDLPYLRFRGDFGTGKTRALLTIGSICYKPFFASGASTVSPIFHILDAFQGTLLLDEADFRFSEATAPLTKLLNNGTTRGMPVLRTMTNRHRELNPQAFRVFGPKVVSMREQFSDLALESRFFTCETGGRPLRPDVPIYLPDAFHSEALALRNALLAWRFRSRFSVGPNPSRAAVGVSPRYRQTSLSLLSLVEDSGLRERIGRELAGYEARVLNERADSFEAAMLAAIEESFEASTAHHAAIQDITTRFNDRAADELGRVVTNKWVGTFVRQRLRLATFKTGGVFVVPTSERAKIAALCERYGIRRAA